MASENSKKAYYTYVASNVHSIKSAQCVRTNDGEIEIEMKKQKNNHINNYNNMTELAPAAAKVAVMPFICAHSRQLHEHSRSLVVLHNT